MKKGKGDSLGALEYVNRKGDTYYLQAGQTKTGKPKYFLARKLTGTPLSALPEGFEIHETPATGIAALRKFRPTTIRPEERRLVEERAREQSGIRHLIVDTEPDALVVYVPGTSADTAAGIFETFGAIIPKEAAVDLLLSQSVYTPMLRFVLTDADRRTFAVQRWCYLGSIDDWIFVDGPRPLAEQVAKYAKHLGKESFYELM